MAEPTRQVLERMAPEVLELVAQGLSDAQVVAEIRSRQTRGRPFAVSRQAVSLFRQRHAAELQALRSQQLERVSASALRHKEERVYKLGYMADALEATLRERGFVWDEPIGRDGETIPRVPVALIREYRACLRDIAEELGQIERPSVNTNIQVNQYLVREYGVDKPEDV